jgi:Na+-transporting NADH:ubiquinone oxidoreductase subunit NqrF
VASGSQRETWFFYGVRNGKEHIMKDHFDRIRREHGNARLNMCYSDPEPSETKGKDYDHGERVSVELFKRLLPSNNYEFYICGPPPMMNSIVKDLEAWGVPETQIHFEAFGPATVKKTAPVAHPDATAASQASAGITVTFAKSNVTAAWQPEIGSILEFAEANGVAMDSGCRAGNCGTCITAIKSGEVKYLQEPGAKPEAGSCLTCVSVPKGNVTLDA